MPRFFERPLGLKDTTPVTLRKMEKIIEKAKNLSSEFGYEPLKTPGIEYYQTVGLNSRIKEDELIRFMGPLGRMVILRPDLTTPIARITASMYKEIEPPFRFIFYGDVYRNMGNGYIEQRSQIDLELIGDESLAADAEIINIAAKVVMEFVDKKIKISVGNSRSLNILFDKLVSDEKLKSQLFKKIRELDYASYNKAVDSLDITEEDKCKLKEIINIKGSLENIYGIKDWFDDQAWQSIFDEMDELNQILSYYDLKDMIIYDLSLIGKANYYTGVIFNLYVEDNPSQIVSGGRYDNLLGSFGRDLTATGMAINLDELVRSSKEEEDLKEKVLIAYERESLEKAIRLSEELRREGRSVIIKEASMTRENDPEVFDEIIKI